MSKEIREYWGDLSYEQMWDAWAARYSFGAKGELSVSEAREIHQKWKTLGAQARAGLI